MRYSLAALLALGLASCTTVPAPVCRAPANAELTAELLFGLSIPGGGAVSPEAFDAFVVGDIAPRFVGFTILPGAGYWQGKAEGARLMLIAAPDTEQTREKLSAIRQRYKARFRQQAVGLITVQSCADL